MKTKHVLASLGLALTTAFAVAIGVGPRKEAKSVKAEGEKWMVTICFDNTVPETSGVWGFIENRKVNFWGTNVTYAESVQDFHATEREYFYAVNVAFESNQTVSGFQINFTENGVKKESQDINLALDSSVNGHVYTFAFPENVSWVDNKWSVDSHGDHVPNARFGGQSEEGKVTKTFTPDPEYKSYSLTNVEVNVSTDNPCYVNLCPFSYSLYQWEDTYRSIREEAAYFSDYFYTWHGNTWIEIKVSGVYDFFITNEYKEGGIVDVKKHEDPNNTYIYYVLEEGQSCDKYIYSWGGNSQFGAWPGTKVTDIATEVTNNGVLHFEGSEGIKLIYQIPVKIGYPIGDSEFKWNVNGAEESEAFTLKAQAAYWYTGSANVDAGHAIDFLVATEAVRNATTNYSVCEIAPAAAKEVVETYNSMSADERDYVNRSKVYTYTTEQKGQEAPQGLVSYEDIVIMLGEIGGVTPVGLSSRNHIDVYGSYNTNTIIIIVVVASTSMVALAVLLLIKKNKHN